MFGLIFFDVQLAKVIGVDEAIVYSYFVSRCSGNKKSERNIHFGMAWTYNTLEAFLDEFPFWGESKIKSIFNKLEENGMVLRAKLSENKRDKTNYYATRHLFLNAKGTFSMNGEFATIRSDVQTLIEQVKNTGSTGGIPPGHIYESIIYNNNKHIYIKDPYLSDIGIEHKNELTPEEKQAKENYRGKCEAIVNQVWNSFTDEWFETKFKKKLKGLPKTRVISDKLVQEYKKCVEALGVENFSQALDRYIYDIANRNQSTDYAHHRFTFEQFIKQDNGARKFVNL